MAIKLNGKYVTSKRTKKEQEQLQNKAYPKDNLNSVMKGREARISQAQQESDRVSEIMASVQRKWEERKTQQAYDRITAAARSRVPGNDWMRSYAPPELRTQGNFKGGITSVNQQSSGKIYSAAQDALRIRSERDRQRAQTSGGTAYNPEDKSVGNYVQGDNKDNDSGIFTSGHIRPEDDQEGYEEYKKQMARYNEMKGWKRLQERYKGQEEEAQKALDDITGRVGVEFAPEGETPYLVKDRTNHYYQNPQYREQIDEKFYDSIVGEGEYKKRKAAFTNDAAGWEQADQLELDMTQAWEAYENGQPEEAYRILTGKDDAAKYRKDLEAAQYASKVAEDKLKNYQDVENAPHLEYGMTEGQYLRVLQNNLDSGAYDPETAEYVKNYLYYSQMPDVKNSRAYSEYMGQGIESGIFDNSGDLNMMSTGKVQKDLADLKRKKAQAEANSRNWDEYNEELRETQDTRMTYNSLAEYGVQDKDVTGTNLKAKPDAREMFDRYPGRFLNPDNAEEYFDGLLYDQVHGEGSFKNIIQNGTDEEYDRAQAEVDDLWRRIEDGTVSELATAGSEQREQLAAKVYGGESNLDRQIKAHEDELNRRETIGKYSDLEGAAYNPSLVQDPVAYQSYLESGEGLQGNDNFLYWVINTINGTENEYGSGFIGELREVQEAENDYRKYAFMTPEMVDKYNKLYEDNRIDEARALLKAIDPYITQLASGRAQEIREQASKGNYGGLYGAATVLRQPFAGASGSIAVLAALMGNEDAKNPNSGWYKWQKMNNTTRGARAETWGDFFANNFGEEYRQAGQWLNGVTYSIADNIMAMAIARAGGSVFNYDMSSKAAERMIQFVMSSSAASSSMVDKISQGMDPTEAALYAVGNGMIEAITEKYSIEALLKPNVKDMLGDWKKVGKFLLKNTIAEGTEEGASDVLNTVWDEVLSGIYGHESELSAQYNELIAQGMNPKDATRQVLRGWLANTGSDMLAGALSGFVMSGGRTAMNTVNQQKAGAKIRSKGNTTAGKTGVEQLIEAAKGMDEGTESRRLAEELGAKVQDGKKVSSKEAGRLAQNIMYESGEMAGKVARDTVEQMVRETMKENGATPEQIERTAGIVTDAVVKNKKLTQGERATVAEVKQAIEAYRQLMTNEGKMATGMAVMMNPEGDVTRSVRETVGRLLNGESAEKVDHRISRDIMQGVQSMVLANDEDLANVQNGKRTKTGMDAIVDNEIVQVTGKEGDNYIVKTADGTEKKVSAAAVTAVDTMAGAIMAYTEGNGKSVLGDEAFGTIAKGAQENKKMAPAKYIAEAMKVYMAARTGGQMPGTTMAESTAQAIWNAAQNENRQATKDWQAAGQLKVEAGKGTASFDGAEYGTDAWKEKIKGLSKQIRNQMGAVAEYAKRIGLHVDFINDPENEAIFGSEDRSTGRITINVAGKEADYTKDGKSVIGGNHHLLVVAAHEFTHWLEQNSTESYDELRQFIFDKIRSRGQSVEALVMNKIDAYRSVAKQDLSIEDAMAEIVADACDQVLGSEKVAREIEQSNPNLYEKIKSFVKDLVARIRAAAAGMRTSASAEARILQDWADELEDRWMKTLQEAQGRQGEIIKTEGNTRENQKSIQQSNNEKVIDYTLSFRQQLSEWIKLSEKEKQQERKALVIGTTPENLIRIGLVKLPMVIDYNHVSAALDGKYKNDRYREDHIIDIEEFGHLGDLLAHPVAIIKDSKPGAVRVIIQTKAKSGKQILAGVEINGRKTIDGKAIDVNEISTVHGNTDTINHLISAIKNNTATDHRIYYINKEKTQQVLSGVREATLTGLEIPSGFINNIPESELSVKDKKYGRKVPLRSQTDSLQFRDWFGKSKVVNEDGTPRIVYHGTSEKFTVFDMDKGRANMDIQGAFFSPYEIEAGGYGENVGAYYLSIKHPASEQVAYKALNMFKGQNEAGKKARKYLESQGYDGVITGVGEDAEEYIAFYPNQIKSATDNIGMFNKNNPDVRFSIRNISEQDQAYADAVERGDMETAQRMVDQAAKAAGYTRKVYHGTPSGGFNTFRNWSYFTENKGYAERYQSPSASSIRSVREGKGNRQVYELYMNPGKEFDTRKAKERKLFNEARMEYGLTSLDNMSRGLPDWTDGRDIVEYIEDNGLDYDTVILDEGADGGYGEEVRDRGISYVTKANMVKSAAPVVYDNAGNVIPLSERFNQEQQDIRYSVRQRNEDVSDWKTYTVRDGEMYMKDQKGNETKLTGLDREYVEAWKKHDFSRMEEILADKIRENGAIPFKTPNSYSTPNHKWIANALKEGNTWAIRQAAAEMAQMVPKNAVLIPIPNHHGETTDNTDTVILANKISEITGRPVIHALAGIERESRKEDKAKPKSQQMKAEDLGFRQVEEIPEGTVPYFVDNVIASGLTAEAAHRALGNNGVTLAYAKSTRSANDGLKRANVTFYDTNKQYGSYLIPLSERIDMSRKGYAGTKFSMRQLDDAYMRAARTGDIETMDELVKQTAERKGFTRETAYHGTDSFGFNEFDMEALQGAIFVTYSKMLAQSYTEYTGKETKKISEAPEIPNKNMETMKPEELAKYAESVMKQVWDKDSKVSVSEEYDDVFDVDFPRWNKNWFRRYELINIINEYLKDRGGVYEFYTRPGKQLVIDAHGRSWNKIKFDPADVGKTQDLGKRLSAYELWLEGDEKAKEDLENIIKYTWKTREIAAWAKENGYDSVRINNVYDDGGKNKYIVDREWEWQNMELTGDIAIFFNPNDVKSADTITYDDDGSIIPPSERFSDESNDLRFSIRQGDMEINRWMEGLTASSLQTEQERTMLKQWKNTRGSLDLARHALFGYKTELSKLEEKPNPTAYEKHQMSVLRSRIEIWQKKADILEEKLAKATSEKGFAAIMRKQSRIMTDLVNGRTADEVRGTVDAINAELETVQKEMEERSERLKQLAAKEAVIRIRQQLNSAGLKRIAAKLKNDLNSDLSNTEIENRLALMALKMKEGKIDEADVTELADMLIGKMRRTYDSYILDELRGRTITLSKSQQAELKGQNRTIREIRQELAGTGIRIDTKGGNTLDKNWSELCDLIPALDKEAADKDMLDQLLNVIAAEKDAARNQYTANMDMEVASMVIDAASNLVPEIVTDKKSMQLIRETLNFIAEMSTEAEESARAMEELNSLMSRLQKKGREAKTTLGTMESNIQDAIAYNNELSLQSEQANWLTERHKLIDQLKSEHTQEMLRQQAEYRLKIEKDKTARGLMNENMALRRRIHTNISRIRNLLMKESVKQNIPEHMKGLAREMLGLIVRNDMTGRKITGLDLKMLQETQRVLDAWLKQDGKYNPDELKGLDEAVQDAIQNALEDIRAGIDFYNASTRGSELQVNLQAFKNALTRISEGVSTITGAINAERSIALGDRRVAVEDQAYKVQESTGGRRAKELTGSLGRTISALQRAITTGNMTPEYFFKMLKNAGLDDLWEDYHRAENRNGLELAKAKARLDEIAKKYGFKEWDTDARQAVKLGSGTVNMTLGQIMSLYATWKREHTLGPAMSQHLQNGGFYVEEYDPRKGILGRREVDLKAHRVTEADMEMVNGLLTDEQKKFVDDIVGFMSNDMSELGNEASMKAYGIKMYKESYYFPFKMWDGIKARASNDSGSAAAANDRAFHPSFSKTRLHGANNALILGDFMTTAADHIVGMINYATMGLANENLQKVLNAQVPEGERLDQMTRRTIRTVLEEAYGKKITEYLAKLQEQLNGGAVRVDRTIYDRMLTLFRKNAVAGSLSVALQQPLSYIRAAMMINPKYLAEAMSPAYWKGSYSEMMAHSGVAVIKKMGRFDMGFGAGAREYITPDGKEGKVRKTWDEITDKATILPELADQMTWTRMWSAVKLEQHALYPDMDVKSDAFLDMVGERFNDLMRKTQVYDSTLTKSQNMRSQNPFVKSITSFMAEPTLTLNVLADAVQNVKEKGGKLKLVKALATFALSAMAQAAAKALTSTGRSPDDKKTWEENFWYRYVANMINEGDPLNLIPGYNDLITLLKDGKLEDDAMGVIGKLFTAGEKLLSTTGNPGDYRTWEDGVGQIVQLFTQLPAKNIMRDLRAMYNWFIGKPYADRPTSAAVIRLQAKASMMTADNLIGVISAKLGEAGYKVNNTAYYDRMYNAIQSGNKQEADAIREYLTLGKGVKDETIDSNMRTMTRNGNLFPALEANKAAEIAKAIKELQEYGSEVKDIKSSITKEMKPKYLAADAAGKVKIRDAIQKAYKAMGLTAADADKVINDWKEE